MDAIVTGNVQPSVSGISWVVQPRQGSARSQTYQTLKALAQAGGPLDCNEIEEITAAAGHRIRYNNANKVLKRVPGLARRIESPGMVVRYEILSAGRAYVRYMDTVEPKAVADEA